MCRQARTEAGFSMIELMVAMAITLIVSASIFGLVASGQNAFRRDPEISERQQNIRVAMERIQRDLTVAGMGMHDQEGGGGATSNGYWSQIFNPEGNEAGPSGVASVINTGELTDVLSFVGNEGDCQNAPIKEFLGGANSVVAIAATADWPPCVPDPGLVWFLYPDGKVKRAWLHNKQQTGNDSRANFPYGQQPVWPISQVQSPGDITCGDPIDSDRGETCPDPACEVPEACTPIAMVTMTVFSYRIGLDTDGIPSLYRSTNGGIATDGSGDLEFVDPEAGADGWQLLARGVTDLQVQYLGGDGVWRDEPQEVVEDDYSTITRQVRVSLQSRTTGNANLGTADASVIQGRLTAAVTPRSAMFFLMAAPSPYTWR